MASWITHLIVADQIMERFPGLNRRGFCVGSIAPDCNVENEDWTAFEPPKAVTHWMAGPRKTLDDADRFCQARIANCREEIRSGEEYAFLLGYYAHLLTDAAYERMARREDRVRTAWARIQAHETLSVASEGMAESWDNIKTLVTRREIKRTVQWFEGEYLQIHPESGYLTEVLPLKEFPVYLDYLPAGCIVRKIGVMGHVPRLCGTEPEWIAISRGEYASYIADTVELIAQRFVQKGLDEVEPDLEEAAKECGSKQHV